jgi:hypothetical protein
LVESAEARIVNFPARKPFLHGQIDRLISGFVKIKIPTKREFFARIFDLCTVRLDGR